MSDKRLPTFIVDCPVCKARVAAEEHGRINRSGGVNPENGDVHYGLSVGLGKCPKCRSILVGESEQVTIEGSDGYEDEWADPIRAYLDSPGVFTIPQIPKVVSESITEGIKSLQSNANVASCVMFGRVLEAICRNLFVETVSSNKAQSPQVPVGDQSCSVRKSNTRFVTSQHIRQILPYRVRRQMTFGLSYSQLLSTSTI